MNEIIKVLMERDDMTEEDAKIHVSQLFEEMMEMDPFEAMDYFCDMTGLEPDYIEGAILELV